MKMWFDWCVSRNLLLFAFMVGGCTSGELDVGSNADGSTADAKQGTPDGKVGADATTGADSATVDASVSGDAMVDAPIVPNGLNVDRTEPQLYDFALDPKVVDAAASEVLEEQYALLDTRVESRGTLVVFLSGFTNRPRDWRNHGRLLAEMGFHVLMPHYNNAWPSSVCNGMGGDCGENTRWEALTGNATGAGIDMSRADSAEGRAIAMIKYLAGTHAGGDWGYYLDADDELIGDRMIIAGISHGASSSGLYGQRRSVSRVVMHSGGWWKTSASQATDASLYYGISHTGDDQHSGHLDSWELLGLPGSPTSIDGQDPPFGDARQLITSQNTNYPHCSVAVHSSSPTDDQDEYTFKDAWRHLYGVN